jgi:Domain of unknown function (DUF4169)
MAEVINLRLARKARVRADKASQAASNRATYGESKAARAARKAEAERTDRHIDGHRREPD